MREYQTQSTRERLEAFLRIYNELLPLDEILSLHKSVIRELFEIPYWDSFRAALEPFSPPPKEHVQCDFGSVVSLKAALRQDEGERAIASELVRKLTPWRKGPFHFLGTDIDAEWRSDLKWERIQPHMPDLRGKRVADIGCNNGYYMFRMLPEDPECIFGLDPNIRFYLQFELLQTVLQDSRLRFLLLGIEHLNLFREFFDFMLCMGVLYHRRDPFTSCRMLYDSLRPDGVLILESLFYPSEDSIAFCPPDRYAKMRNVWFIPSVPCLIGWLEKAGFEDVTILSVSVTTSEEQRKTELAPFESLADFLDPNDPEKTIEGHPAPRRVLLKAKKA